jgi:hypothetical protein
MRAVEMEIHLAYYGQTASRLRALYDLPISFEIRTTALLRAMAASS